MSSGREATLQDRIVDIIGSLASKYKFNGLEFSKADTNSQYNPLLINEKGKKRNDKYKMRKLVCPGAGTG